MPILLYNMGTRPPEGMQGIRLQDESDAVHGGPSVIGTSVFEVCQETSVTALNIFDYASI
ncbi:hypothetical protein A6P54_16160 [Bacillus sp. MKU004]|nr:hypothetical protein A6P54_16160 [Bacillus sp. MKU004]